MAPKYQMSSSLIEKAMSAMKQRTQTPEAKALDLDELFDLESEGLSWVIPGLLPEGETIVLAGAPKAGKTLLAIDAAYSVVTGESYFLGEAVKRGKVLLISTDESANSTKAKLINRGFRRGDKDSIKVLPTWDISQMGALEALLEDFRPNLVIIDSLRRINKGSEISENSAEFADAIYTLKETLERYGASGILIHHTNKDREALGVHRLRGSSAIAGAVWGTWQLDQIPKPDPNNKKKFIIDPKDPTRTLSVFARDIEGQQLMVELNPENSSWVKRVKSETLWKRLLNGIPCKRES
jgi:RecA-family ATPase